MTHFFTLPIKEGDPMAQANGRTRSHAEGPKIVEIRKCALHTTHPLLKTSALGLSCLSHREKLKLRNKKKKKKKKTEEFNCTLVVLLVSLEFTTMPEINL